MKTAEAGRERDTTGSDSHQVTRGEQFVGSAGSQEGVRGDDLTSGVMQPMVSRSYPEVRKWVV